MYKFTEKSDIDKLDSYIKSLLYMMSNKPLDSNNTMSATQDGNEYYLYFTFII